MLLRFDSAFRQTKAILHTIASNKGVTGLHAARKFGFKYTTTDANSLFEDCQTNSIVVTTQHDTMQSLS